MTAKTGLGPHQICDRLVNIFIQWERLAANATALFNTGADVPVDQIAKYGFHDARRGIEELEAMRDRVIANSWAAEIAAISEDRYGVGYNIVTEALALLAGLQELQTVIQTQLGIDAQGFYTGQYMKLANDPPYIGTVPSATVGPIVTKLQEIAAGFDAS